MSDLVWEKIVERFWKYVDKSETKTSCWLWTGSKYEKGYGRFYYLRTKPIKAHRFSYMLENPEQELSSEDFICHHCDTPSCVRPSHLYAGDAFTNVLDMVDRKRDYNRIQRKEGPVGMGWCSTCKQYLSIDNFHKSKNRWNGLNSLCKFHAIEAVHNTKKRKQG